MSFRGASDVSCLSAFAGQECVAVAVDCFVRRDGAVFVIAVEDSSAVLRIVHHLDAAVLVDVADPPRLDLTVAPVPCFVLLFAPVRSMIVVCVLDVFRLVSVTTSPNATFSTIISFALLCGRRASERVQII